MANKNFTDFTLKTPLSGDFVVGYNADGSAEYRSTVKAFLNSQSFQVTESGDYSHAEGSNTIASGGDSHAEGSATQAVGGASHAEGGSTQALGFYSHAEGYGTIADGGSFLYQGCAHAEGFSTQATGAQAHAEGNTTIASGTASHAEGLITLASGNGSHAEGYTVAASGIYSHAEGSYTVASGANSHAEGSGATASGDNSHAEGSGTTASGENSHAEGSSTTASGLVSHAEGSSTTASGQYSHAEGSNTLASNLAAHAEGNGTVASGQNSHAEGRSTIAAGLRSHAAGSFAHAVHDRTWIWKGDTSTTYLSTTRSNQFMVSAAGGVAFFGNVGIGTDSIDNALTVNGAISASNLNLDSWNSVYSHVKEASSNWQSSYEYVNQNFENWDGVYTQVRDVSSSWTVETIMLGWNPATDSNLGQAVDIFAPYNGSVWNSNTNVFEVVNSNSSSPMTRVQIKNTGYYLFNLQLYCYDLKLNRDFLYMLFKSTTSTGAFGLVRYMSRKRHAEDTNAGLLTDEVSMLIRVDTANEFYNWAFNSEDASPYALAAPGNGIYTMSMQITKLRNL